MKYFPTQPFLMNHSFWKTTGPRRIFFISTGLHGILLWFFSWFLNVYLLVIIMTSNHNRTFFFCFLSFLIFFNQKAIIFIYILLKLISYKLIKLYIVSPNFSFSLPQITDSNIQYNTDLYYRSIDTSGNY